MPGVGRRIDEPRSAVGPGEQVPRPQVAVDAGRRLRRSGQVGPVGQPVTQPVERGGAARRRGARRRPAGGPAVAAGARPRTWASRRPGGCRPAPCRRSRRGRWPKAGALDGVEGGDGATGVLVDGGAPRTGLDPGQRQPVVALPEHVGHRRSGLGEPRAARPPRPRRTRAAESSWVFTKASRPSASTTRKARQMSPPGDRRPRPDGGAVDVSGERHRDGRGRGRRCRRGVPGARGRRPRSTSNTTAKPSGPP